MSGRNGEWEEWDSLWKSLSKHLSCVERNLIS